MALVEYSLSDDSEEEEEEAFMEEEEAEGEAEGEDEGEDEGEEEAEAEEEDAGCGSSPEQPADDEDDAEEDMTLDELFEDALKTEGLDRWPMRTWTTESSSSHNPRRCRRRLCVRCTGHRRRGASQLTRRRSCCQRRGRCRIPTARTSGRCWPAG
jgi:hypothetical protein